MDDWHADITAGADTDSELDARTVAKARRVVAANSLDAEDCRVLLSMLGIIDTALVAGTDDQGCR